MRLTFFAAFFMTVLSTSATADLIPPDVSSCQGKNAGDVCETDGGKSGSCILVKNGSCRYHPSHGTTCTDALKCVTEAQGSASAALEQNDAQAAGCSSNNLSYASFGVGMLILLALGSMRRKSVQN